MPNNNNNAISFVKLRVYCLLNSGLCPAGCSVSGPTMEVFGQPAASNLTVTSSPMSVVTGQRYLAGPAAPPPPSHPHSVQVPHADARWAISMTAW